MKKKDLEKQIHILQEKLDAVEAREKSRSLRMTKAIKTLIVISLSVFSVYGLAVIASLHIFNPGEVISAQKINENFAYLDNKINSMGGGGSITVNRITSYQSITLTSTDNNVMISAEAPVDIYLPAISTVPAGFQVRFKQTGASGQFRIYRNGSDQINGISKDIYMGLSGDVAIVELVSDGVSWTTLLQIGSFYQEDLQALTFSCTDGEGAGINNCYNSTSDKNNGFAILADNYLYKWDGNLWFKAHNWEYLINDTNSLLTATNTFSYDFAMSSGSAAYNATTGLYYIHSAQQNGVCNFSTATTHNFSTDEDYVNVTANTNSGCMAFGAGWRYVRRSEISFNLAGGIPASPNGLTLTASPDSTTSSNFWAWEDTTPAEVSVNSCTWYYYACVNPSP